MSILNLQLTNVGAAALAQATQVGPVVLSEIAIGSANWSPSASATVLQSEIKRLTSVDGGNVGGQIHITATDGSTDIYIVNEIGIYTDQGVLFAVYSQPAGTIFDKASSDTLFLAMDVVFVNVPSGAPITVAGDANFALPPATDTTEGIVRLSTRAEVDTGGGGGVVPVSMYAADRVIDTQAMLISVDTAKRDLNDRIDEVFLKQASRASAEQLGGGGGADWTPQLFTLRPGKPTLVMFTGQGRSNIASAGDAEFVVRASATGAAIATGTFYTPNQDGVGYQSFSAQGVYTLPAGGPATSSAVAVTFTGSGFVKDLRLIMLELPVR